MKSTKEFNLELTEEFNYTEEELKAAFIKILKETKPKLRLFLDYNDAPKIKEDIFNKYINEQYENNN